MHHDKEGLGGLIALSQILPISYTLGLYQLFSDTARPAAKRQPQTERVPSSSALASGIDALYILLVCAIPSTGQARDFMPLVLLVRAMLLLPILLGKSAKPAYRRTAYIGGIAAVVIQAYFALRSTQIAVQDIIDAPFGHPAVRALAQDAVIAFVCDAIYKYVV